MSHLNSTESINCTNAGIGRATRGFVRLETGLVALVVTIITIFINILLLYAILTKRKIRSLHALIANLSFVSILASGLGALYICGVDNLFQSVWVCSVFSFFRNMVTSLISLSVLSISHESVRKVQLFSSNPDGSLLVCRVIQWIWGLSMVGAVPSIFVAILVHHTHPDGQIHSVCMQAPSGDNFGLGVIYEVMRSILFHVLVPGYMVFELYKIRATVKHFLYFTMPCPRVQTRVQRVRFIYINSLIFVLFWVPYGIGTSIYKNTILQQRYERFVHHPELDCKDVSRHGSFYILACLFYLYIFLLPLLIYYSNDTFSCLGSMRANKQCCKGSLLPASPAQGDDDNSPNVTKRGDTTFAISVEEGIKLQEEKRKDMHVYFTQLCGSTRAEVLI